MSGTENKPQKHITFAALGGEVVFFAIPTLIAVQELREILNELTEALIYEKLNEQTS